MRLFSWNVNGIRAVLNKGALQQFVKDYDPDILCLQETKAKQGQAEIDFPEYEELWNSADRPGYSGTAMFIRKNIRPTQVIYDFPEDIANKYLWHEDAHGDTTTEGRVLTVELPDYFLITVYTPNSKPDLARLQLREKLWDPAMLAYITDLERSKPVVICGDFNVAHQPIDLARPKDNEGHAGYTAEERKGFDKYMSHGLIDTFRFLHPDAVGAYTWWTWRANARARNIGWRIDYFLASASLKNRIKSAEIYPESTGSDHAPIMLELE